MSKKTKVELEIEEQTKLAIDAEEEAKRLKKRGIELRKFLIPILRRASYRWEPRKDAQAKARVERGVYECAMCEGHFKKKETVIDHVDCVVSVEDGFIDWNTYVERMLCNEEGFQILCHTCHHVKTGMEEQMRSKFRRDKKK